MKTLLQFALFVLSFALATGLSAQKDLQFKIDKNTGALLILSATGENHSEKYDIKKAEFDIYKQTQYVGTVQLEGGKLPVAEVTPKESLHIARIELAKKETGEIIIFEYKTPSIIVKIE